MRSEKMIGGRSCYLYGGKCDREELAADILIQAVDGHDLELLDSEAALIREESGDKPFLLAAFLIGDWNRELSPWEAPPVFGQEGFGAGARETLRFIVEELLPELLNLPAADVTREKLIMQERRIYLGGYSLAGLFALWAAYQTDLFQGIAAVSPSVWFPGWDKYIREHEIHAERVYLSLGNKEEKVRNHVMAKAGEAIRLQYELLSDPAVCRECALEWNQGNHFVDSEKRTAKGFAWVLKHAVIEHPIAPVYDEHSQILILGSFPSVKSREANFFYGHPQNRFWKVVSAVFEDTFPQTVEERKRFLLRHGIAVWDVIKSCDIAGSSDASIKNVTANDLSGILDTAPIGQIFVNGKTAEKMYKRYMEPVVKRKATVLPSTSPANAAWSMERLIEAWSVIRG